MLCKVICLLLGFNNVAYTSNVADMDHRPGQAARLTGRGEGRYEEVADVVVCLSNVADGGGGGREHDAKVRFVSLLCR